MVKFGPAGQDEEYAAVHKSTLNMPAYLAQRKLTAFEYQCGHGVRVSQKSAQALGEEGKRHGIAISVHAPYYISLASADEEKRLNSVRYILQAARAVDWMGGNRIVVHPGSVGKMERKQAMELACDTLKLALKRLEEEGLSHIHICPETMGKINQLGTLEEVIAFCLLDERLIPCIDFGHLYARSAGTVEGYQATAQILDTLHNQLGRQRGSNFHAHFSRIEYTEKGGERRHLTLEDPSFGPDFSPLAQLLQERKLSPTIICESAGTQVKDAIAMLELYEQAAKEGEETNDPH
ncbi:MAG: TIM barrel protein [Oscillospiraceae bacterium]|jgi:deoxyribonuclease-4